MSPFCHYARAMAVRILGRIEAALEGLTPWPRALVVSLGGITFAVGLRALVELFVTDAVPFALTFPAVIAAGLLAGWRGGLLTIAGCQLLVWYLILPPYRSFEILSVGQATSLVLTTIAQLLSVWAVAAYRTSTHQLADESAKRMELMSIALKEIDHRTKNNFQIAASLLMAQAAGAGDKTLTEHLNAAAARLQSIAATYKNLAVSSVGLSEVALDKHLEDICASLKKAMLPDSIQLRYSGEAITVSADDAVAIGLIVNEWITNAAKHAYADQTGTIDVTLRNTADTFRVEVSDQGNGPTGDEAAGLGTSLVEMLAEPLDGEIAIDRSSGTRCMLTLAR